MPPKPAVNPQTALTWPRRPEAGAEIDDWSKQNRTDLRTVELDVQDESSVKAAVAKVLADAGVLDVIGL